VSCSKKKKTGQLGEVLGGKLKLPGFFC